jgi:hypothetical protein
MRERAGRMLPLSRCPILAADTQLKDQKTLKRAGGPLLPFCSTEMGAPCFAFFAGVSRISIDALPQHKPLDMYG